ncbi:hypothetical protein DVH24_036593 [Malus domestica]|uniref:Uncharacterized protein n=1 Tax=Malus domestica TaxID=3750 RepID=A0A498IJU9_MALDO|nr:hypothetical protein DVH24_036593 [Malus domestica]
MEANSLPFYFPYIFIIFLFVQLQLNHRTDYSLQVPIKVLKNDGGAHNDVFTKREWNEAINSASSVTQTLSGEVADGQRKLIALAAARGNSSAVNPLVT